MEVNSLIFLKWGWLALVFIGVSFFIAAFYFRHQSKRLSQAISKLYALNSELDHDALAFFEQAWPVLQSVDCLSIKANIKWFGELKELCFGSCGIEHAKRCIFTIERDDMSFELELFLSRDAAESGSVTSLVVTTFINILEQNVALKQAEILSSQKRLERYRLVVQHEIKNIAQYISLVSEQVQSVQEDQAKVDLVSRLKQTLPSMALRASKAVKQMTSSKMAFYERESFSMDGLIHEVLAMYALEAEIKGDVVLDLPKNALLEVFKNILGNFKDHLNVPVPIKIIIDDTDKHYLNIKIESPLNETQAEMLPERLFEPFWTTSESGLGLGLFLAREILKNLGGSVEFNQGKGHFCFLILLPV